MANTAKVSPEVGHTEKGVRAPGAPYQSHCNSPAQNQQLGYIGNKVTTAKYSPITFLPRNLYEQFSRLANDYFLLISCLQLFTDLSPTSKFATAAPFALILSLNMLREIWEDRKRHQADAEMNNRLVEVVRPNGVSECISWKDVVVGDIVQVKQNEEFPADLILLASTGDQGMCYLDTCNLDGETNLKIRNSVTATRQLDSVDKISTLQGSFEYEPPNNRLYTFSGKFVTPDGDVAIDNENILLRGSTLRNTQWVFGQVVYTGSESKIMMNSLKGRIKLSNLEHTVNKLLIGILFFELVVVTISAIGMAVWVPDSTGAWYIPYVADHTTANTLEGWITFLILLNNYIPISLYISMELAKTIQGQQINWDVQMYHPETDTPALTRTTNLNEELGQVEYIFSDKTGTLTQNVMEFRKCYIAGTSYGFGTTEIGLAAAARGADLGAKDGTATEAEKGANADEAQYHRDPMLQFDDIRLLKRFNEGHADKEAIKDFMRVLSVCHTVVPEGDVTDPSKIKYQAESPDEGALSGFAKALGWFFCGRTSTTTTVKAHGTDESFEVLNVNKFNSARKRMSVVCRTPEGKILLYVKGADNVMLERIKPNQDFQDDMIRQLGNYATEGLRTLVLAKRELSEDEWKEWNGTHHAASTALEDRDGELEKAAELVEKDMILVGATAIEDKLQVGVPDAIATLAQAGIKIWVLTGDKQETAENIGFACRLLRDDMKINYVNGNSDEEVKQQLQQALESNSDLIGRQTEHLALLVDGKSLLTIMADQDLTTNLLKFAKMCKAVIACRVSPNQKRQIVTMVRVGVSPQPMTLSIGDGANDVPMIKEAHVGIGISGNEGMQAVQNSDYAIAQFRFLKRLLLWHGRNNYRRVAMIVLYSLYKNMLLVTSLFFFNFYNGWSGTAVYLSWVLSAYNVFFTFLPIIILGFMDQDVKDTTALTHPQLYIPGQEKRNFNAKTLAAWVVNGLVHCLLVFFVPMGAFAAFGIEDLGVFGNCIMNSMVLAVNLRLVLAENHISYLSHIFSFLSIIMFYVVVMILDIAFDFGFFESYYGVGGETFSSSLVFFTVLVTFVLMNTVDIACLYAHRMYFPNATYVIQEQERGHAPRVSQMMSNENGVSEQSPMIQIGQAQSPK